MMKNVFGLLMLASLFPGCQPAEQKQEAKIKKEVKKTQKKELRERKERSSMGTNESSVID